MIIAVSGTPGTGKTTVAKSLSKLPGHSYVDVKKLIKDRRLSLGKDRKRDCDIIDHYELNRILIKMIKSDRNLVIDSHLSHMLPKRDVDACVVTSCSLKELKKRLKARGYSSGKIRENLDAEIFDTCRTEAEEKGHKVILVDTTKGFDRKELIARINGKEEDRGKRKK